MYMKHGGPLIMVDWALDESCWKQTAKLLLHFKRMIGLPSVLLLPGFYFTYTRFLPNLKRLKMTKKRLHFGYFL